MKRIYCPAPVLISFLAINIMLPIQVPKTISMTFSRCLWPWPELLENFAQTIFIAGWTLRPSSGKAFLFMQLRKAM